MKTRVIARVQDPVRGWIEVYSQLSVSVRQAIHFALAPLNGAASPVLVIEREGLSQ